MGKQWKQWQTLFSWAPKSLWLVTSAMKLKDAFSLEEKLWQTQTDVSNDKGWYRQSYGSSHVQMWELDHKEGWALKRWCFLTVVLEKAVESPSDTKGVLNILGRSDAEAESPVLWLPDAKNWLIGKDPDAGKDWRQEEKGMTEDEMVGWHHWLNGHEFDQALGVGDGQGSLACCSPWGHKESDMTKWLNWTKTECCEENKES